VKTQCDTAEVLARRLAGHPAIVAVPHPSLPEHPDHELCKRLMASGGGVVSFELADAQQAAAVADRLEVIVNAPSLGGTRSTLCWPAGVSHYALSEAQKADTGVSGGLLRLAVGIEPMETLWQDLSRALDPPQSDS